MSRNWDHIQNPDAYARAIQSRIKANAYKTKHANFQRDEPVLYAQLEECWYPRWVEGAEEWTRDDSHLALEHFTVQERRTLLRRLSWLRAGYEEYGSLTEKQIAKAKEIIEETRAKVQRWEEEDERRKANALPWEMGRQEFPCTVVSMKLKDVPKFSYHDSGVAWKVVVQREDGSRLYCTAPRALVDAAYRKAQSEFTDDYGQANDKIELSARGMKLVLRVDVVHEAEAFAFGKRPHVVSIEEGT